MPRLACERSRKTQPQTSRGHAFSRSQRPSSIAANATASTRPIAPSSPPAAGRAPRGRRRGPAARRAAASSTAGAGRLGPAVVGQQQRPQRLAHLDRARDVRRPQPGRLEAAVLQPGGEALRAVEQVVVVLAVERVDEVLHEPEVAVGRRAPAGLHRAGDEVGAFHAGIVAITPYNCSCR